MKTDTKTEFQRFKNTGEMDAAFKKSLKDGHEEFLLLFKDGHDDVFIINSFHDECFHLDEADDHEFDAIFDEDIVSFTPLD